jgi:hypothetical protein
MNSKHRQGMGQLQIPDIVQLRHVCEENTKTEKQNKMYHVKYKADSYTSNFYTACLYTL